MNLKVKVHDADDFTAYRPRLNDDMGQLSLGQQESLTQMRNRMCDL